MKVTAIFGPPGTGKTRTLVDMVRESTGQKTLLLSFTKAAALEIKSRLGDDSNCIASTIHSLAFSTLGLNRAQVVDSKKLIDFGKESGIPFKGGEAGVDEIQEGDEYSSVLAFSNNRMIDVIPAYEHFGCPGTRHRFLMFVKMYNDWKRANGYLDFDDMLHRYIISGPALQVDRVFLDEAQDCSPLQWHTFRTMLPPSAEVVIAGDDDQAIYEWNGADPHAMMDFLQATEGEMRILNQSHRVPRIVHDLAHEVALKPITKRVDKKFLPRAAEGKFERYGDMLDIPFRWVHQNGGAMVLVRDRWKMEEVKRMLNRDMIPYEVMGGWSPWTSRTARALRAGEEVVWDAKNSNWREFYRQADLTQPVSIILSTIHQAKGREHPRVVLDLDLPTRTLAAMYNDRDAELRVLYVALTRASEELIVCGGNPLL